MPKKYKEEKRREGRKYYHSPKKRPLIVEKVGKEKNIVVEKVVYYYPDRHRDPRKAGRETKFSPHKKLVTRVVLSDTHVDEDTGRFITQKFLSKRHKIEACKRKKPVSIKYFEKRMIQSLQDRSVTTIQSRRAEDGALVITYPGGRKKK